MGHGTVADEIKGRAAPVRRRALGRDPAIEEEGVNVPLLPRRLHAVHGARRPRWRSRRRCGSDIALVFDECTPFHGGRDYTARSTERTHRWLDRCLDWHAQHGPEGQIVYGIVQGGVEEDLRRASAQEVAARDTSADRHRRHARRGQGPDVHGRRVDDRGAAGGQAAPPARHRRGRRPGPRRRARHRHLRLRDAHPDRPPRHGRRPRPGQALARRPRQGPLEGVRRAAARGLPLPGLRARLLPRLPALPVQGQGADRDAPAHDPQPRLPAAADGRAARRDRRGPPPAAAAAVRAGAAPWDDVASRRSRRPAGARGRRPTTR